MSQHIEIEFKNLLTKAQYEELLSYFSIKDEQIHRQTNHYFDTPHEHLKNLSSGLRIRELPNAIECTLKEKNSKNSHLETTDFLSPEQVRKMLSNGAIEAPNVKARLDSLQVPIDQLSLFGTLTTDRVEIEYKGGLLVLDHSFYLQHDDYEVEYETTDESIGQQVFANFLQHFKIQQQVTPKKIARFMQALHEKG